jgi:hypothetical protein
VPSGMSDSRPKPVADHHSLVHAPDVSDSNSRGIDDKGRPRSGSSVSHV